MGAGKKKRERFFEEHPICCFCTGKSPAVTIDHVPSRACFLERQAPEHFEFPACAACNSGSSLDEQVFAFYVRLLGPSEGAGSDFPRLLDALRNNAPQFVPEGNLPVSVKRRVMGHWNMKPPAGETFAQQSLVQFAKETEVPLNAVIRKLVKAVYYKETGRRVEDDHRVFGKWSQMNLPGASEALEVMQALLPQFVLGQRTNTNLGDQFGYWWGWNEEADVFAMFAIFGGSLCGLGGLASADRNPREMDSGWHRP